MKRSSDRDSNSDRGADFELGHTRNNGFTLFKFSLGRSKFGRASEGVGRASKGAGRASEGAGRASVGAGRAWFGVCT